MSCLSRAFRASLITGLLVLLIACGGGGGGGASPASGNPPPESQSITFAQVGPVALEAGQSLTNAASGGAGNGAMTYSSSNPTVATVNTSGYVVALSVGSTVISATKAADTQHAAATASYSLNVIFAAQTINFAQPGPLTMYAGSTFTNTFSAPGSGYVTYSSSNTAVATIDSSGMVTNVGAGNAIITVTKAADAHYAAATASYSLTVRVYQVLTFDQAGPLTAAVGDTLVNAASGAGSGAVSYSSSNTAVATVSGDGVVTSVGAGTAVITADKAADAQYNTATANYALTVSGIAMTAWIGSQNTLLNFPSAANGYGLYRSSDANCNFATYLSCTDGQYNSLTGAVVTDTAATLSRPGFYVLKQGGTQANITVSTVHFTGRYSHQVVVYNNRLWLIGGYDGSAGTNDVWSSTDVLSWTQQTAHAAFSPRWDHQAVVFNNKMWVIDGLAGGWNGDVWSSTDGITWTPENMSAPFGARYNHQVVVYHNKMWVIGGNIGNSTLRNDVWSSSDGVTWQQETANAAFSPRDQHRVVVYNDKMWLIGGCDSSNCTFQSGGKSDVWTSTDGITWTQQLASSPLWSLLNIPVVVFNNQLCIGGSTFSSDGINWAAVGPAGPSIGVHYNDQAAVFQNKIWIIGGMDETGAARSDVWSSSDGANWIAQTTGPAFSPRSSHQVVVFKNQLWLVAGGTGSPTGGLNDIWSSVDGIAWTQQKTHVPNWGRRGHQLAVFNEQLWLIGGIGNGAGLGNNDYNDVWSSSDGINWTQRIANAAFVGRGWHQVVVYNNKLWVIGGATDDGLVDLSDVWSSSDGVTWTEQTANAAFPARRSHKVVVYNNQMWLIGGGSWGGHSYNDVWSSSDGINWIQQTAAAQFTARAGHQALVYNNQLWLISGSNTSDVWSSTDGINWLEQTANAAFSPRSGHQVLVHNNQLLLIGGFDTSSNYNNDVWSSTDGIEWRKGFRNTVQLQ